MRWVGKIRPQNAPARILFVALFAILLLIGSTAQLTHVHPNGSTHPDCALCQSAHNVAQPTSAPCVQQVFVVFTRVAIPHKRPYREHIFSFSLCNRPPPDQTAVS